MEREIKREEGKRKKKERGENKSTETFFVRE